MTSGENPAVVSEDFSFEAVLDETCDRLWDRKVRYSIRRLREMDAVLLALEQDLDEMLRRKGNGLGDC
ncbi:hypothetical protein FACS189442_6280 [Spirochaetia bacterium]|nr:hypothetical protein FACS189442_6280 [Spirochaetia bacterium]